jgi:hypothetical protein
MLLVLFVFIGVVYLKLDSLSGNLKEEVKSCRLRFPGPYIKHGGFTEHDDRIITFIYDQIGSR